MKYIVFMKVQDHKIMIAELQVEKHCFSVRRSASVFLERNLQSNHTCNFEVRNSVVLRSSHDSLFGYL